MPRDIFAEQGIKIDQPRDIFAEQGITPPVMQPQKKPESFLQQNIKPNQFMQNVGAGVLSGATEFMKAIPDLATILPPNMIKALPYKSGERPIDKFDPYKAMGTTDQPINTLSGLEQTAGQLFGGAKPTGQFIKGLVSPLTNAFLDVNPEATAQGIQKTHDLLKESAGKLFKDVESEAVNRGINVLPIDPAFIRSLTKYLPKTDIIKDMLTKSTSGDYSALRKLQSELFERGSKAKAHDLTSENIKGEEMLSKRDQLNKFMSDYFKNTGHKDLSDMLSEARFKYKNLMDTYYDKLLPVSVRKLVGKARQIPKDIVNALSVDSDPMNKLKQANPFIEEMLNKSILKNNAIQRLKNLGIGGGLFGGAVEAYNVANKLLNKNP